MKRADDQVLWWMKRGDSAELVPTQPVLSWLVIEAQHAVKWAFSWAGYATDVGEELSGIQSLYAAAA